MVRCWYAEPDKPTTCRLNQLYAGKTGIATSNLLVLLLVAVPVAGLLIFQLAGIWLGFGFRRCKYCWLLVAGGRKPYRPTPSLIVCVRCWHSSHSPTNIYVCFFGCFFVC